MKTAPRRKSISCRAYTAFAWFLTPRNRPSETLWVGPSHQVDLLVGLDKPFAGTVDLSWDEGGKAGSEDGKAATKTQQQS